MDVTVAAGEILALVGESGIGKSSILNVVAGFVPKPGRRFSSPWHWFDGEEDLQYSGSVTVNGIPIDGTPPEGRNTIGMVMQGGVVYEHLSVLRNITFPMRMAGVRGAQQLRAAALTLLREVGLFDDLEGDDLDHRLRKKAASLSGGERQRVAIARALAKAPSVFLLDEAFANLDPILREELFDRFAKLIVGQPRCAMVVTHDLSDLRLVQRVLLLGPGKEGADYCYFRREGGSFVVERASGDQSDYWQTWQNRIEAIGASPAPR
ncbi:MAG TPA: ATP-binding cassette domain-containing protein [Allosphingosinicella sp.]|nr:ATP-binding cassette domain-containing protein [Allosphingosinicella sp.]